MMTTTSPPGQDLAPPRNAVPWHTRQRQRPFNSGSAVSPVGGTLRRRARRSIFAELRRDPGLLFGAILRFTPLLWLSGVLAFCTPLAIVYTFFRERCWKHLADPAVAGWFAIAAAQAFSTIINWGNTEAGIGSLLYRFCSAPISGWIFLGSLLAIGKRIRFSVPDRFARRVATLGVYLLCLGAPLLAAGFLLGITDLEWLTPVGRLIPASLPSARFEFTAQFLIVDDFVGQTLPRLVLFFPWPTCLGFAGSAILFISLAADTTALTLVGRLGGIFAVFASTSRAAIVGTFIALGVYGILHLPRRRRPAAIFAGTTLVLLCLSLPMLFLVDTGSFLAGTTNSVSSLRQDSSSARESLYQETFRRSLREPYLGHGWQGDILQDTIPLNVGSHSTLYGLFYTGGAAGLLTFIAAALTTGHRLLRNALTKGQRHHAAFCLYLVLLIMCYGECIYSFAIPVFFAFLWIGKGLDRSISTQSELGVGAEFATGLAQKESVSYVS